MPILNAEQMKRLGEPPKPPGPQVQLADKDGKPNRAWVTFMVRQDEWLTRLYKMLGE